ncbi:hypothetical protein FHU41_001099 [Psychromicrobium silvestre]|uniref:Peptidase S1 domain-containing protein n=1 Tax=Psychromicrobium silvestre TaxID=1645614 RepID=A0A7Y9S5E8_9MICC|nr:AbfB domain-containing protein [Psychromicrobium silvestre]NYE94878.1 hypothetical protein [Psychromicrobium silvestre]
MFKTFKGAKSRTAGIIAIAAVSIAGLSALPASALSNGTDVPNNENLNVVKVATGYGTCTGALIDQSWVATVASCFSQNPANYASVPAGKPALPAKVLFGLDAASRDNAGTAVEQIQPYKEADGRDLVLVKLATPALNTTPIKLATAAPVADEKLDFVGWGRTKTEWVPKVSHKASFTVSDVNAKEITINGFNPVDASLCLGDSGAPGLRTTAAGQELVALNSRSWQKNCIGSTQTQDGAFATRIDDVNPWIQQTIANGNKLPGVASGSIVLIKNAGITDSCLGLPAFTKVENTTMQSVKCADSTRTRWEVTEVSAGIYTLEADFGKLCLSVLGESTGENAALAQTTCSAQSTFQQWKTLPAGGGKFQLSNVATGFVAGAAGVVVNTDEKVTQQKYAGQAKQQWTASVVGQAKYDITHSYISIQAVAPDVSKGKSVRHENGLGYVNNLVTASSTELQRKDASWKVVPGLADPKCYSFESVSLPGKYLYADSSTARTGIVSAPRADLATWCGRIARSGTGINLQWYANPTRILRHNSGNLYAGTSGGPISGADSATQFDEMTSWSIGAAWATPTP